MERWADRMDYEWRARKAATRGEVNIKKQQTDDAEGVRK